MAIILDKIALSPLQLTIWLAKKLHETAYEEVTDASRINEELMALQMKFEMGEITEDAYEARETELMDQLEAIRKIKEGE